MNTITVYIPVIQCHQQISCVLLTELWHIPEQHQRHQFFWNVMLYSKCVRKPKPCSTVVPLLPVSTTCWTIWKLKWSQTKDCGLQFVHSYNKVNVKLFADSDLDANNCDDSETVLVMVTFLTFKLPTFAYVNAHKKQP